MLLGWPLVTLLAFGILRTRPHIALLFSMLGGMLLLPEVHAYNPPGLPELGKREITSLSVLVAALAFQPRRLLAARPGLGLEAVVLLMIPAAIATALTNGDPIVLSYKIISGLTPYDAFGMSFTDVVLLGIPFLLGRAFIRSSRELRDALVAVVLASLLYSVLVLFEARMAPILHRTVYGFGQHSWLQVRRFGGWRPMVFMSHGLALSLFIAASAIAAAVLSRARIAVAGVPARFALPYLAFVVLACRSLASMVYPTLMAPLVLFARPRTQLVAAAVIAGVVLTYPILRQTRVVPTETLVGWAGSVSDERAGSLAFRFRNEDALLDRARQRIWFGWGGFGRTHYSERRKGKDLVADGYWIVRFASRGVAGQLGYGLLFVLPIWQALRALERIRTPHDRILFAGLGLVVGTYALDTLPNGLMAHFPLLLAGGLAGVSRGLPQETPRVAAAVRAAKPRRAGREGEPGARAPAGGRPLRGAGRWR
jgi:hypothetical protein